MTDIRFQLAQGVEVTNLEELGQRTGVVPQSIDGGTEWGAGGVILFSPDDPGLRLQQDAFEGQSTVHIWVVEPSGVLDASNLSAVVEQAVDAGADVSVSVATGRARDHARLATLSGDPRQSGRVGESRPEGCPKAKGRRLASSGGPPSHIAMQAAGAASVREAAKWLIGIFAAIAAVLTVGIQVSSFGNIEGEPWRLFLAFVGATAGLGGIALSIWYLLNVMMPSAAWLNPSDDFNQRHKESFLGYANSPEELQSEYVAALENRREKLLWQLVRAPDRQ